MMRYLLALSVACCALPVAAQCVDRVAVVPDAELQRVRARLVDASGADDEIRILAYIFNTDAAGVDMLRRLVAASRRGASVRVLIDGIGPGLQLPFTPELMAALHDVAPSLDIRVFHPKENLANLGRRMHDKLFMVGRSAVIGSSSTWDPSVQGRLAELDLLVTGELRDDSVLKAMREHFELFWWSRASIAQRPYMTFPLDSPYQPAVGFRRLDPMAIERWRTQLGLPAADSILGAPDFDGDGSAVVSHRCATLHYVHDTPEKSAPGTLEDMLAHIANARRTITIVNPYLILVPELRALLERKRERDGVRIVIVTASIKDLAAELPAIGRAYVDGLSGLARAGIEVREYRDPGRRMLHAKLVRIDEVEHYVGGFNFDPLSARSNTENGLWIRAPNDALDRVLEHYITHSTPVTDDRGRLLVDVDQHCASAGCGGVWRWLTPLLRRWL
ncbi:phospholipase D-like domain-containing protein [Burkholderia pyrrocinia]